MVKPINNFVLIELESEKSVTLSGIILVTRKPAYRWRIGRVLETGPGWYTEKGGAFVPMVVKKGDRVLVNTYSVSYEIPEVDEEKKQIMVREIEIISVLDDDLQLEV